MTDLFFDQPILNSPYASPTRHWELDAFGQPTQQIIEKRRRADFITPIPKPRRQRARGAGVQQALVFDEGKGLSTQAQQYDPTAIINAVRAQVDKWREIPDPADWGVTPETARPLQHWRGYAFNIIRPFFCQIEAIETAIWLTEAAPNSGKAGRDLPESLEAASREANPELNLLP